MAPTMSQVVEISGVSRDTINKWIERGVLRTAIPETPKGVARIFSRENALEIAFTASLTLVGVDPHIASITARHWVHLERSGQLYRFWVFNPRHGTGAHASEGEFNPAIRLDHVADLLPDDRDGVLAAQDDGMTPAPAAAFVVVDRVEIVRRVDSVIAAK